MLDHIGLPVSDYARSKTFYETALAPLGYGLVMEVSAEMTGGDARAGFGPEERPQFRIGNGAALRDQVHVAFSAKGRAAMRAFHAAALATGGRDNGPSA